MLVLYKAFPFAVFLQALFQVCIFLEPLGDGSVTVVAARNCYVN